MEIFEHIKIVDNELIQMNSSTKFMGVTLDSKPTWNEHIINQCHKAKGILMQCRKAVGLTSKDHEMDLHSRC